MQEVHAVSTRRLDHAHHQIAAAFFVASLIIGGALILAAELIKPERYEFHNGPTATSYIIYDRNTGRATNAEFDSKNPLDAFSK